MPAEHGEGPREATVFATDDAALSYLRENIPPAPEQRTVDLPKLQQLLFEPTELEQLRSGRVESRTEQGLTVSYEAYDCADDDIAFAECYQALKGDPELTGQFRPILNLQNLTVESAHFSYTQSYLSETKRKLIRAVYWLPGLDTPDTGLSHDYVNLGKSTIYLVGQDGHLARPVDMLALFHEIGHIETYDGLYKGPDTQTHDFMGNSLPRTVKNAAYELLREKAANAWAIANATPLFVDLGMTAEEVVAFYDHVQLASYNAVFRKAFLEG